ncbi:MAG: cytochrome C [Nitrospirae bacterium]|nr:MAG: cytochrome C [Nitrospirota bacterium]
MLILKILLLLLLTLIPYYQCQAKGVGIGRDGTIAAKKGKAKTVAELVAMYDSSSCKQCHPKIYSKWENSLHAASIYGTGRTAATIRTTFYNGFKAWAYSGVKKPEDVTVEHLRLCTKCHLPQLDDATDDVAKEIMKTILDWAESKDEDVRDAAEDKLYSLSINCLICHNRNAITHKWTDGYPQADTVYGTKDGTHFDKTFTKLKKSPIMKESILCGQCHGLGPNFDLENPSQCATLYGHYLWAYRGEGGRKTCQNCHMEESGLGHDLQSYRSKVMQKMALDFNVETMGYQWRDGSVMVPEAEVVVEMTNKAGHAIPDG